MKQALLLQKVVFMCPEELLVYLDISVMAVDTPVIQGIIHRDLKANNIFCSAHGIVKLGDFGISKALGDNQNVARTMVGTPYYMSPEILKVSFRPFLYAVKLVNLLGTVASHLPGSTVQYFSVQVEPYCKIDFVTCHALFIELLLQEVWHTIGQVMPAGRHKLSPHVVLSLPCITFVTICCLVMGVIHVYCGILLSLAACQSTKQKLLYSTTSSSLSRSL